MAKDLAVVVLAAGAGTRMNSDLPKVLHPIGGAPMIAHVLATARALDPARLIVVLAPGMDDVAAASAPAVVAIQRKPRGTADAVMAAREALRGHDGDVLVAFADTPLIEPRTLENLLATRRGGTACAAAVLGMDLDDPGAYGRLVTTGDGKLDAIVEARDATPAERAITLCNSGVMALDGAVMFDLLDAVTDSNAKREFYLTDLVRIARARGLECRAVVADDNDELMGVNSRTELALAEQVFQWRARQAAMEGGATLVDPASVHFSFDTVLGRDVTIEPNVVFGPGVDISDGAVIRAFCHIEGARIGRGAVIGPFARLRPGADLGEASRVGNFVEIKNATLAAGAKANHLSYIGDAQVGRNANIGAGTITCNYDGFRKSETRIGNDVFIGSNTALVAPVVVGDGAVVGAGSVITDNVPADALALARGRQTNLAGRGADMRARHTKTPKGTKH